MAYTPPSLDPFAGGEKSPSLSWRGLPIGSAFTLRVLEPAKLLQSRDFTTQELAFWDEAKTQPKMAAVVNVEVLRGPHSVGEKRSVWAQRPSAIFTAIADAQSESRAKIDAGGILHLRFVGETKHQDPRMNPIKNYQAKYEPPVVDAFTSPQPAPQMAFPAPKKATW